MPRSGPPCRSSLDRSRHRSPEPAPPRVCRRSLHLRQGRLLARPRTRERLPTARLRSRRTTGLCPLHRPAHGGRATGRVPGVVGDLDGRTVVHVTQGTQNIDPSDLIRPAVEALADRDVIAVVATGVPGRDELPFAVPANVRVAGFLPYAALLPRVDLLVTNGGGAAPSRR